MKQKIKAKGFSKWVEKQLSGASLRLLWQHTFVVTAFGIKGNSYLNGIKRQHFHSRMGMIMEGYK